MTLSSARVPFGASVTLVAVVVTCAGALACTPSAPRVVHPELQPVKAPAAPLEVSNGAVSCVEAIRYAWSNAPRVRAAAAVAAVSEAKRTELRAGYVPQVNAAADYTAGFSGSGSNLGLRGMMISPFVRHWAAGLEASWSVLEFVRVEPRVDVTYAEEAAAKADQARIERDVALMIVDVYERALVAEEALRTGDAEIAWRKAHVAALEALVGAGGAAPPTDLLQARASLAHAEADRAVAAADRDGLRAVLATLVGDERMATVTLVLDAPTMDGNPDPEGRAARAYREAATRLRDLSWREVLPRVIVGGSIGYANPPIGQDPGIWAVGVSLVVPLTAPIGADAREEGAARAYEAKAYDEEARKQELDTRRATLRATVKALDAALPAAEASTKAAREALAAIDVRAKGGLAREVEVETSRALVTKAEVDESTLRLRLAGTKARLAWMGG